MARPNKIGLSYFPFDIDFFEDEKIEAISGEFGIKGEITAIKLLCAIYRNGYFISWNEMLKMKLLNNLPGISSELLEQILKRLIKWGFFDEDLFNTASILTSSGIQKRYFSIAKRRKNNENYPYLLVNVYNNPLDNELMYAKTDKEKKIKENKNYLSVEKKEFISDNVFEKPLSDCLNELLDNQSWVDAVTMNTRSAGNNDFTVESFKGYLKQFFIKLQNEGETAKSPKDAMAHFARWLNMELKNGKNSRDNVKSGFGRNNQPNQGKEDAGIKSITFGKI